MRRQWVALDERIKAFDSEFAAAAKAQDGAKRLLSIPGIGALNATALVPAVGDAGTFARGQNLAAWLGLEPRQVTTGGRRPAGAPRHHQAGEQAPPQDADPGRSGSAADAESGRHTDGRLAPRAARAGASQRGRGSRGGQDGPHRVGAAPTRRCLQGHVRGASGGLNPDRLTRNQRRPSMSVGGDKEMA